MNAYEQLYSIRDFVGESVAAHWSDRFLLTCLNQVQEKLAQKVAKATGGRLTTSTSVTPVDSVITLPADCAKPVYLEETSSGNPISWNVDVSERRVNRQPATQLQNTILEAYPQIGELHVNKADYTTACTLWYQIRVPELHVGTCSAGSTGTFTLSAYDGPAATTGFGAKIIADYYNGIGYVCVAGTGIGTRGTITDYTAARVATLSATTTVYAASSVYGLVSRLPEQCHHLMWLEASLIALAKPSSLMEKEAWSFLKDRWVEAQNEFIEWISTPHIGSKRTRITEIE